MCEISCHIKNRTYHSFNKRLPRSINSLIESSYTRGGNSSIYNSNTKAIHFFSLAINRLRFNKTKKKCFFCSCESFFKSILKMQKQSIGLVVSFFQGMSHPFAKRQKRFFLSKKVELRFQMS